MPKRPALKFNVSDPKVLARFMAAADAHLRRSARSKEAAKAALVRTGVLHKS